MVQSERYLLECYRYIELNPVRAAMVDSPGEYRWSSYLSNAHGQNSNFLAAHPVYLALGNSERSRLEAYRAFFHGQVNKEFIDTLRLSTNKGMVIGSRHFKQQLEQLNQRKVDNLKMGRPRLTKK